MVQKVELAWGFWEGTYILGDEQIHDGGDSSCGIHGGGGGGGLNDGLYILLHFLSGGQGK